MLLPALDSKVFAKDLILAQLDGALSLQPEGGTGRDRGRSKHEVIVVLVYLR